MKNFIILFLSLLLTGQSYALYKVYPQVSAKITYLAQVSQTLKKGEVMVRLDNRIAKAQLAESQAILKIKRQLLADAELTHKQVQQLFDNLVRSKRELELAQIAHHQAKYKAKAQENRVQQQQLLLEQYQILAPFDAIVVSVPTPRNTTNHHHPKPLLLLEAIGN